jgi:hypothetical protein
MPELRRREVVRLAELAAKSSSIEDVEFDDCELLGPAVVAPLENLTIDGSNFDAPPEALFIEVEDGRYVVGVIALRNVTIRNCRIRNVAILGTRESIAAFRSGFEP